MIFKLRSTVIIAVLSATVLCSCGDRVAPVSSSDMDAISSSTTATEAATIEQNVVITTEPMTEPATEPFSVDVSVPSDWLQPSSYVLEDFEAILQEPELPTGCEIVSLAQVLNYLGFDIDKVELCNNFMPVDYHGAYTMNQAYIGDPRANNGFGCNAPVIVRSAEEYFESIDSPCYAVNLTGTDFRELFYQIEQGRPVVVWSTMNLTESYKNYKWTAGNGEEMWFNDFQHCMAIYGYDTEQGIVYAADPLVGNTTYPLDRFEMIYNIMDKQAVVICGNSETEGHYRPNPELADTDVVSRKEQLAQQEAE